MCTVQFFKKFVLSFCHAMQELNQAVNLVCHQVAYALRGDRRTTCCNKATELFTSQKCRGNLDTSAYEDAAEEAVASVMNGIHSDAHRRCSLMKAMVGSAAYVEAQLDISARIAAEDATDRARQMLYEDAFSSVLELHSTTERREQSLKKQSIGDNDAMSSIQTSGDDGMNMPANPTGESREASVESSEIAEIFNTYREASSAALIAHLYRVITPKCVDADAVKGFKNEGELLCEALLTLPSWFKEPQSEHSLLISECAKSMSSQFLQRWARQPNSECIDGLFSVHVWASKLSEPWAAMTPYMKYQVTFAFPKAAEQALDLNICTCECMRERIHLWSDWLCEALRCNRIGQQAGQLIYRSRATMLSMVESFAQLSKVP